MFSTNAPMSRWKAAGIHLSISLIIAALVGSLIYFVWYPPPYFTVAGGSNLMVLIMSVDVVLGPFLTLAVFRVGKKGLKFDLAAIASLQIIAFCYGIYIIAVARPVFIVAAIDRFIPVYANQLEDRDVAEATVPEFATRSWTGPRLVAAAVPKKNGDGKDFTIAGIGGKDIEKFPKTYLPYAQAADILLQHAHPLNSLKVKHPEQAGSIARFEAEHGVDSGELVYLPLIGRVESYTMIVSAKSKQPIGVLAIDPW